ncbi:MAG: aldose 1-epimerase family protein [Oscillospiraceae bacterium]|nr:aldose 1-epimerase family protein [Oscillospiraceae bacterium]
MIVKIENEFLTAEISGLGAELYSIRDKTDGHEFLWQGREEIWSGRSPILFPIVGRLMDDSYRYNGTEYKMAKHGFAREMPFEAVSQQGNAAVFLLKSSDETRTQYPFEFELYVRFELNGRSLTATHTVVNKNDGDMYFSIGGHPGFNCELGYSLVFDETETLLTETIGADDALRLPDRTPVPGDGREIVITGDIFNDDALILSGLTSKAVTLKSRNHDRTVRFTFGDVPFLGIWAKPGAPYVCIEPWFGVNDNRDRKDDISEKEGIQRLVKGGQFELVYTAEVK